MHYINIINKQTLTNTLSLRTAVFESMTSLIIFSMFPKAIVILVGSGDGNGSKVFGWDGHGALVTADLL